MDITLASNSHSSDVEIEISNAVRVVRKLNELPISSSVHPIYWRFCIYKVTSLIAPAVFVLLMVWLVERLGFEGVDWRYVLAFVAIVACGSFFLSPISDFSIDITQGVAILNRSRMIFKDERRYEITLVSVGNYFLKFRRGLIVSYLPSYIYGKAGLDALASELGQLQNK